MESNRDFPTIAERISHQRHCTGGALELFYAAGRARLRCSGCQRYTGVADVHLDVVRTALGADVGVSPCIACKDRLRPSGADAPGRGPDPEPIAVGVSQPQVVADRRAGVQKLNTSPAPAPARWFCRSHPDEPTNFKGTACRVCRGAHNQREQAAQDARLARDNDED